jgi:signal transduction histidine kinase
LKFSEKSREGSCFWQQRSLLEGTGLGLAQTKSIVEAQGGSVGVYSVPGEAGSYGPSLMVARCTDSNK